MELSSNFVKNMMVILENALAVMPIGGNLDDNDVFYERICLLENKSCSWMNVDT